MIENNRKTYEAQANLDFEKEPAFKVSYEIHTRELVNVINNGERPTKSLIRKQIERAGINYTIADCKKLEKFNRLQRLTGRGTSNSNLESFGRFLFSLGQTPYLPAQLNREIKERLKLILPSMDATDKAGALAVAGVFLSSKMIITEGNRETQELAGGSISPPNIQFASVWRADLSGALKGAIHGGLLGGAAGAVGGAIIEGVINSAMALLGAGQGNEGNNNDYLK